MMNGRDIIQEYEEFVYIMAHDMAAPQRHIREFSQLLLDSLGTDLNDEQLLYKKFIEEGLSKISRMQAVLLDLSRITTQGEAFASFSSEQCLQGAVARLTPLIEGTKARIILPNNHVMLWGDGEQIGSAVLFILDNALRYVADGLSPMITVSVSEDVAHTRLSIRDNGIGIPPENADQIFKIFRRLHGAEEYGGGIGVGLTLAQKIIRRHGGEINFHALPNGGSEFYISLPKKT